MSILSCLASWAESPVALLKPSTVMNLDFVAYNVYVENPSNNAIQLYLNDDNNSIVVSGETVFRLSGKPIKKIRIVGNSRVTVWHD